jgi:hypothetical protein
LALGEKNTSAGNVLRKVEGENGICEEGEGDCAGKFPVGIITPGDFFGVWKFSCTAPAGGEAEAVGRAFLRFRKMPGGDMMPMRALLFGLNIPPKGDTGLLPDVRLNFGD